MSGSGASAVWIQNAWATQSKIPTHTSFCHWAAPEFTGTGQTGMHAMLSVIAFAVAVWSAYEQLRIFNMRYEIAKGYADIAQEQWDRFDGRYRPLEDAMISECLAETPIEPDYLKALSEYAQFAEAGYAQARQEYDILMKQLCLCPDPSFSLEQANALWADDSVNLGYREAEDFALKADDIRFNKRSNLLNVGRDLLANSAKYGGAADGMLSQAGEAAGQTMHGMTGLVSYLKNRYATTYPGYMMYAPTSGVALSTGGSPAGGAMATPMSIDET
jgi:hypothetical protein